MFVDIFQQHRNFQRLHHRGLFSCDSQYKKLYFYVKTVVLFFEKGTPTKKIWYYQLNLDRNLGKTNALNEKDLEEFFNFSKIKQESENGWTVKIDNINKESWDLSVNNPNKVEEVDKRTPKEIIEEIEELDLKANKVLKANPCAMVEKKPG